MKPYIFVFTNQYEVNADIVIPLLEKRDISVIRINTEQFPIKIQRSILLENNSFKFFSGGKYISNTDIRSCWYRQPWSAEIPPKVSPGFHQLIKDESEIATWSYMTLIDTFWMNHPLITHLLSNNKMLQMKYASEVGFTIPDTIITNNPQELLDFCEAHNGYSAIKMMSGKVFDSKNPDVFGCVYTQMVSHQYLKENIHRISLCPVFAQEYIKKKVELRITVVGNSVFPCTIHSQDSLRTLHDWRRYDFQNVKHEIATISEDLKQKLFAFMKLSKLSFGAFDFILTPQEEYVFLEVNPGGQWGWIEELTGMPISESIVNILVNPPNTAL
jgi:glutathione synthase/RimK-type ligase-like ATP-grasp enzyme